MFWAKICEKLRNGGYVNVSKKERFRAIISPFCDVFLSFLFGLHLFLKL